MGIVCAANGSATMDFSRYAIILERKPFGEPPPEPPPPPPPPINPADSFAANIRLSALIDTEDGGIRVGLIDQKSNQSFFLGVGDIEEGIELVSASYEDEEAVLRRGEEMAVIKLQSGEVKPLTPQEQQERLNRASSKRLSYAERRAARMAARAKPKEPIKPKYSGEELERHLREYQMEVIRQGLPPLPIPLTEEMDAQLVSEGVLPPQ